MSYQTKQTWVCLPDTQQSQTLTSGWSERKRVFTARHQAGRMVANAQGPEFSAGLQARGFQCTIMGNGCSVFDQFVPILLTVQW